MRTLKIFGERNTGTRAVIRTLSNLPDVRFRLGGLPQASGRQEELAKAIDAHLSGKWRRHYRNALRDDVHRDTAPDDLWKHAVPRLTPAMIGAQVATICMVRNPYSWALSMWKRPYHQIGPRTDDLEEFLAMPWMTERREGAPSILLSPMELWSLKVRATITYQTTAFANGLPCRIIRFEDFVQNPAFVLRSALSAMDLPTDPLKEVDQNTKPGGVPVSELRRRYADELWRAELSSTAIQRITEGIDWSAASLLGYARITPDEAQVSDRETGAAATA